MPLDPSYQPARLAAYLEDSGAAVVLTQPPLAAFARSLAADAADARGGDAAPAEVVAVQVEVASVPDDEGSEGDEAADAPAAQVAEGDVDEGAQGEGAPLAPQADHAAYIMFTSGSTVRSAPC